MCAERKISFQNIRAYFLIIIILGSLTFSHAQERIISGKIISNEDNLPLPGVTVLLKGTNTGTISNRGGEYKIQVPDDEGVLVFSFVGFEIQEITVGSQTSIDILMVEDIIQLNEVVVTALNIPREKRSLGYSTQELKEKNLRVARETNLNNSLAGKIAGVQVIGGSLGKFGEAAIRIRGIRGLEGKAPIYVVDGIVIQDPSVINMDNVKSVNVLKGASASALYGNRARDGVVVITSKEIGMDNLSIDIRSTTTFENISLVPEFQNEYGAGFSQDWQTFTYIPGFDDTALEGLDGAPIPDFTSTFSWGPPLDGTEVAQWDAFTEGTETYGQTRPWLPQPNNIKDFYQTGHSLNNSVSFGKAGNAYGIDMAFTNINRTGVIPGSDQQRNYFNLGTRVDLSDKIGVSASMNYSLANTNGYIYEEGRNLPYIMNIWFQRQLDMSLLKEYWKMPGNRYTTWNRRNARDPIANEWENPYTYAYDYTNEANDIAFFGKAGLWWELIDGLKISANAMHSLSNMESEKIKPTGSVPSWNHPERYERNQLSNTESNYELLTQYDKEFSPIWETSFLVGGNVRRDNYSAQYMSTAFGISVPYLYNIQNSRERPDVVNNKSFKEVRSIFGRALVGYNGIAFLDATIRSDWSSSLPEQNNNYTYPSIAGTFVFSELLSDNKLISFGKLRLSYAQVGADIAANQLDASYYQYPLQYDGYPIMWSPNFFPNPDIRPALSNAYEAGFELNLLRNRIRTDFTVYKYINKDEILLIDIPTSTGYWQSWINAGLTTSSGWELTLGGTLIQKNNLRWDLNLNLSQFRNSIEELHEDMDVYHLSIGGTDHGAAVFAETGKDWGVIKGPAFERDSLSGRVVVDDQGWAKIKQNQDLGHILPDMVGGIFSRLEFRGLEFSFTIDWQKGGGIYSYMNNASIFSGQHPMTVGSNDLGNPMRDPVLINPNALPGDPDYYLPTSGGLVVDGVTETGSENTTRVDAFWYWLSIVSADETSVYDASYVKLREIRLAYNLPSGWFDNLFIKNASFALVANNVWLIYSDIPGTDPSEHSGSAGRRSSPRGSLNSFAQLPSVRSLGFDIRIGI